VAFKVESFVRLYGYNLDVPMGDHDGTRQPTSSIMTQLKMLQGIVHNYGELLLGELFPHKWEAFVLWHSGMEWLLGVFEADLHRGVK
jgi:hypothetical protein